nr:SCP2 domain-containing protein [Yersinia pestis]
MWQNSGTWHCHFIQCYHFIQDYKESPPVLGKLRVHLVRQGPALLRGPLKVTPFALQRQVLEHVLGWQFRQALLDGELAFLESRWLKIEVRDLALQWFVTVENGKLLVSQQADADVSFSGDANDLILIAARKEDPDTLFFQRRLRIEGDTELGLYVKNLMDAIDLESMPTLLRVGLQQLAEFIEAGQQEGAVATSRGLASC